MSPQEAGPEFGAGHPGSGAYRAVWTRRAQPEPEAEPGSPRWGTFGPAGSVRSLQPTRASLDLPLACWPSAGSK